MKLDLNMLVNGLLLVAIKSAIKYMTCADSRNNQCSQLVVRTVHGKIEGSILNTIQKPDLKYYAFRGIPYAKPPLNKLRFQPPLKPDFWNNTKSCKHYGHPCLQISQTDGSVVGKEDCLVLNVFTPELNTSNLKPVMLWIHGGGHIRGSGDMYGPDYLMEKPIVLVTINYRLNIFGYLTVNDENAYGNMAIKDQIAALEWVQENIVKFGGDPTKVTIFGESTGANSVSLLQLSSKTKGLFHQVIAESGSALNPRYLQKYPLKYVYSIARYFNISVNSTRDIVEGLQNINAAELTRAAHSFQATGYKSSLEAWPFFPVIEVENTKAVITRSSYELLEKGNFNKLPFIFGINTNEGSLGLKIVYKQMNIEDFDKKYELFAAKSLNNKKDERLAGTLVRNYFLGNFSARDTQKFARFLGQELIGRGVKKQLDFQRKYSAGYFYRFSYKGTHTTRNEGVGHGEETQYLFAQNWTIGNLQEYDIVTRKRMVEMWTNFATFGSPIPEDVLLSENVSWKPCDKNSLHFLDIGKKLTSGTNLYEEDDKFWNHLFHTYGIEPYQTY